MGLKHVNESLLIMIALICWIVIYQEDSAFYPSNNWDKDSETGLRFSAQAKELKIPQKFLCNRDGISARAEKAT